MLISLKDIKNLVKMKKARDEQGLFVTEGRKLFTEAPKKDIVCVVTTKAYEKEHAAELAALPKSVGVIADLDDKRFAGLSDTKTPQGILTVMKKPSFDMEAALAAPSPLYLLLENLQDPGNAGTILRTAEAAGVTAVFLTEGSVDFTNPKTVRSTMGSVFRVPHFYVDDVDKLLARFRKNGVTTYAAHLKGDRGYTDAQYKSGTAFFIGNEGRGLTDGLSDRADVLMKIPMSGQVESLNAAMAAGILMYEAKRQRSLP